MTSVVVAMLTYLRPDDLKEALPELIRAADELINRADPKVGDLADTVRVLVVDNDPAGGAESLVESLGIDRVTYISEKAPGIAAARNAALDRARVWDADVIVFIDDDERPRPGWLLGLVDTYRRFQADAVAGPVITEFSGPVDPFIVDGRFFERVRHSTGAPLVAAATNNLLLDLRSLQRFGLRFDDRFGLTGGSDYVITRSLADAGARLVWCDEAIVIDKVPASRLTRDWVLRKAFRIGNAASRVDALLASSIGRRLASRGRNLTSGLARVAVGLVKQVMGLIESDSRSRARGQRLVARGMGMASGALGIVYAEYGRHGSPTR